MMAHRRSLFALLIACAGVLVACGGDEGPDASTQTTTTVGSIETTTTTPCEVADATTDAKSSPGPSSGTTLLTDVRTGRQTCADRVVFEFREGPMPESYTVEYQPGPFSLGESDQPVAVAGSSFLVVRFLQASGVDDESSAQFVQTYTGPESLKPTDLAHVVEVRRIEDFENVLIWVIGLDSTRPFSVGVLDGPPRFYLDIA